MYQFILWLVPTVEKFPRSQKFVLGDRIQAAALDVLDALIEATYTRSRDAMLARANLGSENACAIFLRLSQDLHLIDRRRYEHAAAQLDEIGRLSAAGARRMHARRA